MTFLNTCNILNNFCSVSDWNRMFVDADWIEMDCGCYEALPDIPNSEAKGLDITRVEGGPYITTPLQSSIYMPIPSALVHITNFKSLTFVNCDIICGFFSHLLSLNGTHLHRVCIQKPPLSHNYRSVIRPLSNYNILKYVGICLCIFPTSQLTKTLKTTSLSIFLTTYFMFSLFGFLEMKFLHPVISSA